MVKNIKISNLSQVLLSVLILLSFILIYIPTNVNALAINNPSANYYLNSTHNFSLTASFSESNIYAVRIKLTLSNATINSFTPTGGWLATIGECTADALYTSTEVCVSLAKSSTLSSGEALGTLNITFNALGSVTLVQDESNGYSDGNSFYPYVGTLTTLNVVNAPEEEIPDEEEPPVEDPDDETPDNETPTNNNGNNTGGSNTGNDSTDDSDVDTDQDPVDEDDDSVDYPLIDDEVKTVISGSTKIEENTNGNDILRIILGVNILLIGTTVFFLYRTLRS